jgi:hypothetical protein
VTDKVKIDAQQLTEVRLSDDATRVTTTALSLARPAVHPGKGYWR